MKCPKDHEEHLDGTLRRFVPEAYWNINMHVTSTGRPDTKCRPKEEPKGIMSKNIYVLRTDIKLTTLVPRLIFKVYLSAWTEFENDAWNAVGSNKLMTLKLSRHALI
jgi:hypothetical protein